MVGLANPAEAHLQRTANPEKTCKLKKRSSICRNFMEGMKDPLRHRGG
jgi:hypothetical protein